MPGNTRRNKDQPCLSHATWQAERMNLNVTSLLRILLVRVLQRSYSISSTLIYHLNSVLTRDHYPPRKRRDI
ncbi:hypothetical protein BDV29DRAFT_6154 [Aspergillus leporis]|uniref:Uncharacterized protein n=1 Tax=Aspergillus leporis TaxID=41062 RepID=A0A5N5WWQ7_9EURO|nr:hypothetical protein BDV29DRAFT_6154 [Aspergillus leporis]